MIRITYDHRPLIRFRIFIFRTLVRLGFIKHKDIVEKINVLHMKLEPGYVSRKRFLQNPGGAAVRTIVVDNEKWKWSVHKKNDYSEYTPCGERVMTLQGPDGYRRSFDLDSGTDAVTPSRAAEIIREKKKTWPEVGS